MTSTLLTLNIGSSSIKYALFDWDGLNGLERGKIICDAQHSEEKLSTLLKDIPQPSVIAHRIVHGGDKYKSATLLDDAVLSDLEKLSPFAPLHQPHNLNGVRIAEKILPTIPQYGCFDTAFHAGHDELHSTFALPVNLRDRGIKRYGFHGLSYDWISRQINSPRAVIAHLGSGASLCALRDGKSIDSTMGLTALDGLPMSTRSGSIDAGLILYLAKNLNYSPTEIETVLYTQSGLLGLSELSGDVKTLLSSPDPRAKFALDYFAFKTAQHIAMMAVSLGGMDTLVFTGGVGENADPIRSAILDRLSFLPHFESLVIPTNEEKMMALQIRGLLPHA
jgi:acetate kinase